MSDPRTWGALLFLLFSLITGIFYFTWAITGISLSVGLLVLVIGIPFAGIFILSIRGLALLEGRLVEALLGVRMPHRPIFSNKNPGLWNRFKALISDKYTWFTLAYMILHLPLGVIYFSVFITLVQSLWALLRHRSWPGLWSPDIHQLWHAILFKRLGFSGSGSGRNLDLHTHITPGKIYRHAHGKLAKAMLVRE